MQFSVPPRKKCKRVTRNLCINYQLFPLAFVLNFQTSFILYDELSHEFYHLPTYIIVSPFWVLVGLDHHMPQ